jgi:type I restriction-modification system DNA methylase subunit
MFEVFCDLLLLNLENNVDESTANSGAKNIKNNLEDIVFEMLKSKSQKNPDIVFRAQPNGSQKFPDFTVEINNTIYNIECKSSNNGIPVWNCGFPRHDPYTWYILYNRKNHKIRIARGDELISKELFECLQAVKEDTRIKELQRTINEEINKCCPQSSLSFSYYIRDMFNQTSPIDYDVLPMFNRQGLLGEKLANETIIVDNSITANYLKTTTKSYRNNMGQFFTGQRIQQYISHTITNILPLDLKVTNVLEPSFGSGELLSVIYKHFEDPVVTGFEIETALFDLVTAKYPIIGHNEDFLLNCGSNEFDYILANPPYNELGKTENHTLYKQVFGEFVENKSNVYVLFMKKCFNLLANGGVMTFIIPTSFKSSISCNKIRTHILSNSKILDLINLGKFDDEVTQEVICLTLLKTNERSNDYCMITNNISYLSADKQVTRPAKKMSSLGLSIYVGKVVWSQHKLELTDDDSDLLLLYSENIEVSGFKKSPKKKQYIKYADKYVTEPPFIAMKRTVNNKSNYVPVAYLSYDISAVENHVFVIKSDEETLKYVLQSLLNRKTGEHIKSILGTVHISKANLLDLPIFD